MIAIRGKETNLIKALNSYKGNNVFMDTDIPMEDFKSIQNFTRHTKGLVRNITILLYNKEIGKTEIVVSDSNKLPKELKDFLETAYLVVFRMDFDISLLLNYGVKPNIKDDINVLLNLNESIEIRVKREERLLKDIKQGFIKNTNLLEELEIFYTKNREEFEEEEYKKAFEVKKQMVYAGYFGLFTDVDNFKVTEYLEKVYAEQSEISNEFKEKYDLNVKSMSEIINYIVIKFNIVVKNGSKKEIMRLYKEYPKYSYFFEKVITYRRNASIIRLLLREQKMFLRVESAYDIFGISQSFAALGSRDKLDIYKTEANKSYYISIESNYHYYRYFEKVHNNIELPKDFDYHKYTASILYNKSMEEVSKEERNNAKLFNFNRFLAGSYLLKGRVYYTLTNEQLTIIKEMYRLNDNRISELSAEDILSVNKLIYDKLGVVSEILNKRNGFDIVLSYTEYGDTFVFKVSNKINPYTALKLIADAFDTTNDIGIRLLDTFSIGNDLKELKQNSQSLDITYDKIVKLENEKGNKELRQIVKEVIQDINKKN